MGRRLELTMANSNMLGSKKNGVVVCRPSGDLTEHTMHIETNVNRMKELIKVNIISKEHTEKYYC